MLGGVPTALLVEPPLRISLYQKKTILERTVQSDDSDQPFDDIALDYTYSAGGSITAAFEKGFARYRWLSGPFQGVEEHDLKYRSKRIGEDVFVVNWHDKSNFNFVTLVINLSDKVVHSSALLYYGTPKEPARASRARRAAAQRGR